MNSLRLLLLERRTWRMTKTQVVVSKDLGEFFYKEVTDARSQLGIQISELSEYYVVRLLCDFSRHDGTSVGEPLALMYKKATEASFEQRVQLLKQMGDAALYVAGFFTEFVERQLVDVDYYISMGGGAYSDLSGLVGSQRHGDTLGEMYSQLSSKFTELVDLLNEISDRHKSSEGDAELLKLYDRWLRTGSERARKILIERGLTPPSGLPTDYTQ
jgi:hypothetical protein